MPSSVVPIGPTPDGVGRERAEVTSVGLGRSDRRRAREETSDRGWVTTWSGGARGEIVGRQVGAVQRRERQSVE